MGVGGGGNGCRLVAAGRTVRVLYLAPVDLSRAGGQAAHVRRVSEALERNGHEIRLLTHRPTAEAAWSGPAGGQVHAGGPGGLRVPRLRHLASESALARALGRESRRFRPHLLLVRQEALSISPWLAGMAFRRRPVPLVVESNSSLPAVAASAGASRARVAWLASWEGRLLRAADAVGAVTSSLAASHGREYAIAGERLFVVPNGAWIPPALGASSSELRGRHGIGGGDFLVGFAGNLNQVQGLDLLLRVLVRSEARGLRAWVIGDGPERLAWQKRAEALGAPVAFLGAMPEEDAARHLQATQAIVAPYRAHEYTRLGGEVSSLKVLTALSCDRPLLVTDAPGLRPLQAVASVTLVEANDEPAWVHALRARSTEWESAGRPLQDWPWPEGRGPGRRFIEAGHTWDHTAAAWEPAFARAISGSRQRRR